MLIKHFLLFIAWSGAGIDSFSNSLFERWATVIGKIEGRRLPLALTAQEMAASLLLSPGRLILRTSLFLGQRVNPKNMSCQNHAIYLGWYSVSSSAWLILFRTPFCYRRQTWLASSHIIATVIWSTSSFSARLIPPLYPKDNDWRCYVLQDYKHIFNVILNQLQNHIFAFGQTLDLWGPS